MRHLKYFEDIKIPIKVGDTVLGGRFKNKKTVVKKIGKNKKGDITINDKPLLKFRIIKESLQEEVVYYLSHLEDDGFKVTIRSLSLQRSLESHTSSCYVPESRLSTKYDKFIRITKPIDPTDDVYSYKSCKEFNFSEIEDELVRFLSEINPLIKGLISQIYVMSKDRERTELSTDNILNREFGDKIISLVILFKR